MVINYKLEVWNGLENDDQIANIFRTICIAFRDEINKCINKFPFQKEKQDRLFWLSTEMTWLGLWNNAIMRSYNSDAQTLQELSVYNEKNQSTRLDLLLRLRREDQYFDFLFEAKLNEWKGGAKLNNQKLDLYFEGIKKQGMSYVKHLGKDFENYYPKVVPLVFEWMRSKKAVDDAKKCLESHKDDTQTHFCALFAAEDRGLRVYGKVFSSDV